MINVINRPFGVDWCKMPMPWVMDSDRKTIAVVSPVPSQINIVLNHPDGFTPGKYITIKYGDVEINLTGVASPDADAGTQYEANGSTVAAAIPYFERNYFINRDFTISHLISSGIQTITFVAKVANAFFDAQVLTDDTAITSITYTNAIAEVPTPNFAYLVDIYLQKTNTDNLNAAPFERLPSIILAPNTGPSEFDIAPEILPYTTPAPPMPFPQVGFTQPEYMRTQALRYRLKFTEVYGIEPVAQVAEEMIGLVPFIDANIAVRGGVRKNIYPWVYEQGNVNVGGGTADVWSADKIWLHSFGKIRRVSPRQYNWLSILATGIVDGAIVKIKYYVDATGNTEYNLFTLAWPSGRTSDDAIPLRIPVGLPTTLPIATPGFTFNKYEIRIVDGNDGLDLYPPVTFYVEPEHHYERFLIFENSFGGWESFRFIGQRVQFAEVTGETFNKLNDLFNDVKHSPERGNHSTMLQEEMELNSGPLRSLDEVYYLVDLLISECIYFHHFYDEHNDYYRVERVPDSFQLHQDDNNHYYINLKVRKAFKDTAYGYLPVY